jgi:hypothetical protein
MKKYTAALLLLTGCNNYSYKVEVTKEVNITNWYRASYVTISNQWDGMTYYISNTNREAIPFRHDVTITNFEKLYTTTNVHELP